MEAKKKKKTKSGGAQKASLLCWKSTEMGRSPPWTSLDWVSYSHSELRQTWLSKFPGLLKSLPASKIICLRQMHSEQGATQYSGYVLPGDRRYVHFTVARSHPALTGKIWSSLRTCHSESPLRVSVLMHSPRIPCWLELCICLQSWQHKTSETAWKKKRKKVSITLKVNHLTYAVASLRTEEKLHHPCKSRHQEAVKNKPEQICRAFEF